MLIHSFPNPHDKTSPNFLYGTVVLGAHEHYQAFDKYKYTKDPKKFENLKSEVKVQYLIHPRISSIPNRRMDT